jgi:hypothetical protein
MARRCAICMFCSIREGVGRMRSRSRSAMASHRSSCIPTGSRSVPSTRAETLWPSIRLARIERPFKKPKREALPATTPARCSGAIRVRRRRCSG